MFWKNREFAEDYNTFYPIVFSAVYSKIGNIDDSEDICQELFIKFYGKIDEIENKRKWLNGALRIEVLAFYRKKKPDAVDIDNIFPDISLSFVNGFRDIRIIINEALENMDNYRDESEVVLFELVAVRNFTYGEAGKQLGLNARQVRYRYELIVKRLLDYLARKGIASLEDLL